MSAGVGRPPIPSRMPVRWPYRPRPQPDELLSSYLCRVAGGMSLRPVTLLTTMFGSGHPLLGQDIDNFAPDHVIDAVAWGVGVYRAVVEGATLREFDGWLMTSYSVKGRKTWVLPTDAKSNHRRRHGLQFCPV